MHLYTKYEVSMSNPVPRTDDADASTNDDVNTNDN